VRLSYCSVRLPEAEKRRIKIIWVVRGTRVPLAGIFKSVAEGYPFVEIQEVFGLTLQQLMAILQFAAEGAAPTSAGR